MWWRPGYEPRWKSSRDEMRMMEWLFPLEKNIISPTLIPKRCEVLKKTTKKKIAAGKKHPHLYLLRPNHYLFTGE